MLQADDILFEEIGNCSDRRDTVERILGLLGSEENGVPLILVGAPGVGKTSLLLSLRGFLQRSMPLQSAAVIYLSTSDYKHLFNSILTSARALCEESNAGPQSKRQKTAGTIMDLGNSLSGFVEKAGWCKIFLLLDGIESGVRSGALNSDEFFQVLNLTTYLTDTCKFSCVAASRAHPDMIFKQMVNESFEIVTLKPLPVETLIAKIEGRSKCIGEAAPHCAVDENEEKMVRDVFVHQFVSFAEERLVDPCLLQNLVQRCAPLVLRTSRGDTDQAAKWKTFQRETSELLKKYARLSPWQMLQDSGGDQQQPISSSSQLLPLSIAQTIVACLVAAYVPPKYDASFGLNYVHDRRARSTNRTKSANLLEDLKKSPQSFTLDRMLLLRHSIFPDVELPSGTVFRTYSKQENRRTVMYTEIATLLHIGLLSTTDKKLNNARLNLHCSLLMARDVLMYLDDVNARHTAATLKGERLLPLFEDLGLVPVINDSKRLGAQAIDQSPPVPAASKGARNAFVEFHSH